MGRSATAADTTLRWAREVIINPGATIILALLLLIDAGLVSEHSELQGLLFVQRTRSWHWRPSWQGAAIRDPTDVGRYRVVELDNGRALAEARDADLVYVSFWEISRTGGAWAATYENRRTFLMFSNADGRSESPETAALRRTIAEDVLPELGLVSAPDARALASANIARQRVLWPGVAHNTLTLALLAAFLASLFWVRHVPTWAHAFRHSRAWKRGRCGRCGYPIAGLPGPRCPECGDTLGP